MKNVLIQICIIISTIKTNAQSDYSNIVSNNGLLYVNTAADFRHIVQAAWRVWRSPPQEHARTTKRATPTICVALAPILSFWWVYVLFSRFGLLAGFKVATSLTRQNDDYTRRNDNKGNTRNTCHIDGFESCKHDSTPERHIYRPERQTRDNCHNCHFVDCLSFW